MKALPNIISIFRICLVPIFIAAFVLDNNDIRYYAIGVFIVANASDILDGYIARRFNAQSRLGKILDPLGDKLVIFSALVCLATIRPILTWVACIYFIKEILMGIGGCLIGRRGQIEFPSSNWLGKTTTVTFFIMCVVLLAFPVTIPDAAAIAMMSFAICMAIAAFVNYLFKFIKIMKKQGLPAQSQPAENSETV